MGCPCEGDSCCICDDLWFVSLQTDSNHTWSKITSCSGERGFEDVLWGLCIKAAFWHLLYESTACSLNGDAFYLAHDQLHLHVLLSKFTLSESFFLTSGNFFTCHNEIPMHLSITSTLIHLWWCWWTLCCWIHLAWLNCNWHTYSCTAVSVSVSVLQYAIP
jgi:hypothetical protein